jgi:hypothetical protein
MFIMSYNRDLGLSEIMSFVFALLNVNWNRGCDAVYDKSHRQCCAMCFGLCAYHAVCSGLICALSVPVLFI